MNQITISKEILVGAVYLHNKTGNHYVVVGFSQDHDNSSANVLYKRVEDVFSSKLPYSRPIQDFVVYVEGLGKDRFTILESTINDYFKRTYGSIIRD